MTITVEGMRNRMMVFRVCYPCPEKVSRFNLVFRLSVLSWVMLLRYYDAIRINVRGERGESFVLCSVSALGTTNRRKKSSSVYIKQDDMLITRTISYSCVQLLLFFDICLEFTFIQQQIASICIYCWLLTWDDITMITMAIVHCLVSHYAQQILGLRLHLSLQ